MGTPGEKTLKLTGGPAQTVTWVKIDARGDLIVDHYDFSDVAQNAFGNDVAFLLTIQAAEKARLWDLLAYGPHEFSSTDFADDQLLQRLQARFDSYFEIKAWLEANRVPFEKTFDSWA